MDFPCSECAYCSKCFPVLKWFFARQCQQGRRMKKPQAQLSDFPQKEET